MNILVTLNSGYIGPLCVMLKSLMINENSEIDLYVAHSSLTEEDFSKIDKVIDKSRCRVHSINVDPKLLENAPVLKRISKETYYRLLVLDIIPEDIDKLLYMDPDIVVNKSIKPLYEVDLTGKFFAGAGHTLGFVENLNKWRLDMPEDSRYINAGIIMFNLKEFRKSCTTQDIFNYIEENERWLFLSDQDVINGMFGGKILHIDPTIFNLDEKTLKLYKKINDINLDWVEKNTAIIHFNGSQKPWKENYKGELSDFYFRYKRLADEDLNK